MLICVRVYICSVHMQKFLMERMSPVSDNQDLSLCHGASPKLPTSSDICILLNYKASEHMWTSHCEGLKRSQCYNFLTGSSLNISLDGPHPRPNASTVSPLNLPSLIITFRSPDTQIFFRTWGGEGGSLGRGVSIFPQKNSFKNPIFCIWVFIGMQM